MRESFWKAMSLALLSGLIVVVASWASASQEEDKENQDNPVQVYADPKVKAVTVNVESTKQRYVITGNITKGTDHDKIMLYDTWDAVNTGDVWVMKNPHTPKPSWEKIPFEKK